MLTYFEGTYLASFMNQYCMCQGYNLETFPKAHTMCENTARAVILLEHLQGFET